MKTYLFVVETNYSKREIFARSKKEAVETFKKQLGTYISSTDKITVR